MKAKPASVSEPKSATFPVTLTCFAVVLFADWLMCGWMNWCVGVLMYSRGDVCIDVLVCLYVDRLMN